MRRNGKDRAVRAGRGRPRAAGRGMRRGTRRRASRVVGERGEDGPQAGALDPVEHRVLALQQLQVGGLPDVRRAAEAGRGGPGRRAGSWTESACAQDVGEAVLASGRSRRVRASGRGWGASKLPGTWKARVPPGARASSQPGKASRCPGTHWSAALETIRSYGLGRASRSGRRRGRSRGGRRRGWGRRARHGARSSICGRVVVAGDAGGGPAVGEQGGDVAGAAAEVGDAGGVARGGRGRGRGGRGRGGRGGGVAQVLLRGPRWVRRT